MQFDRDTARDAHGERKKLLIRFRFDLKLVFRGGGVHVQFVIGVTGDRSVIGWFTLAVRVALVGVTVP